VEREKENTRWPTPCLSPSRGGRERDGKTPELSASCFSFPREGESFEMGGIIPFFIDSLLQNQEWGIENMQRYIILKFLLPQWGRGLG
jgi:hypothetical protein